MPRTCQHDRLPSIGSSDCIKLLTKFLLQARVRSQMSYNKHLRGQHVLCVLPQSLLASGHVCNQDMTMLAKCAMFTHRSALMMSEWYTEDVTF